MFNHLYILPKLYPDKSWKWWVIQKSEYYLRDCPSQPWDWDELSRNPNITWEIVQANHDKPWNWRMISYNKFNRINAVVLVQRSFRESQRRRKEHLKEIRSVGTEYYYRPGKGGYHETATCFAEKITLFTRTFS